MLRVKLENDNYVKIKVVGVGGAGGNIVGRMVNVLKGVDLISINTDTQALSNCAAPIKLQIGSRLTGGLGTGADPEKGKFAANEDKAQISTLLKNTNILFLTTGLGGGTGTGASPVIAKIARDSGAIVIGVVTTPFNFEGQKRADIAKNGLDELRSLVDTLITIPNEKLFKVEEKTSLLEGFKKIDEILYQAVSSVSDLITQPGLMNLDFADIRTIMENGGDSLIGIGIAKGEGRAKTAAQKAINNPLLSQGKISGARNLLISISGNTDLGLSEVNEATKIIYEEIFPLSNTIFGAVIDDRLGEELRVTIIATGLSEKREEKRVSTGRKRVKNDGGPTLFPETDSIIIKGEDWNIPTFLRKKKEDDLPH